MSVDQRDAWVRAYLEDVFNGHNLQSLDRYMTANLVSHRLGDPEPAWAGSLERCDGLCDIGQERADALAANYLGRDAENSLFASGEQPAAFLAITLHTLELAYPAAATWNLPITLYTR